MLDGNGYGGAAVRDILRTADTEWAHLLLDLTGATPAEQACVDIDKVRAVVFGHTLGHVSAEAIAPAAAAAGLATAFVPLATIGAKQCVDMSTWAHPLGVPQLAATGSQPLAQAVIVAIACVLVDKANVALKVPT